MAASSLNNMTVPGADGTAGQGLLMPKLQYRFRVTFANFGISGTDTLTLTRQVVDCARPTVDFGEVVLEVYNSKIYLAGKPAWQTLAINLRDDASGKVSKIVGEQLQKQFDFQEQSSAAAGNNYKFQLNIEILDGGNGVNAVPLETWELYGCYIQNANYQQLNYATNDPVTIGLTLRYDNAVQTNGVGQNTNVGVGEAIGRKVGDLATAAAASQG